MSTTVDFYSGGGDGWVDHENTDSSSVGFDACHDGTGFDYNSTSATFFVGTAKGASSRWYLYRAFLPFDTSALPNGILISSAILYVYASTNAVMDDMSRDYMAVVQTFQASNTTLVVADFIDCGSDDGTAGRAKETPIQKGSSNIQVSNITTGYKSIELNATGIGWVSKTSYTKIGLRTGDDLEGIAPTLAANGQNKLTCYSSNQTGIGEDPYLSITYTLAGPANIKSINGLSGSEIKSYNGTSYTDTKSIDGLV